MAKKNLIHITKHTGKMAHIPSISTTCLNNILCQARMKTGKTICAHCFSVSIQKRYSQLTKCLIKNTEVLTSSVIAENDLPVLNNIYFRFESFGDLNNEIQVINYFNICKKNPKTRFALWTKNPWFIDKAIKAGNAKPENLNIIFSSVFMNDVNLAVANYYTFIDKVFTVYDKEHAKNVEINCGSRDCWNCGRCYEKHSGGLELVNELLK